MALTVTAVPGLALTLTGVCQLAATWTALASNDRGSPSPATEVRARGPEPPEARATTTAHEIAGLTNGVTYTVRVAAVNAQGGGNWSAKATGIPGTPVPALPSAVWSGAGLTAAG